MSVEQRPPGRPRRDVEQQPRARPRSRVAEALAALARSIAGGTRNHGRAQELARIGRVQDLTGAGGELRGVVRTPASDFDVVVTAAPIDPKGWSRLADALADRVEHLAALASGDLPPVDVIEDALTDPLVPEASDLDWTPADPILAAALLIRLAATVDNDAVVLLGWRGQATDQLVHAVRARRGAVGHVVAEADVADPTASPDGVPQGVIALAPPVEPEALVRSLGQAPVSGIVDAVRAAAEFAWQVAAGAGQEAASDAVLLAELRGLGAATAADLAERLGIDADDVARTLEDLHGQGRVLRAGHRYRAA